MPPITWRNVNAPDFTAGNRLLDSANRQINSAIQGGVSQLQGLAKQQDSDEFAKVQASLVGLSPEEAAARAAQGYEGPGDAAAIGKLLAGAEGNARKQATADFNYQEMLNKRFDAGLGDQIAQATADNDVGALDDLLGQARGQDTRAGLIGQIDEIGDNNTVADVVARISAGEEVEYNPDSGLSRAQFTRAKDQGFDTIKRNNEITEIRATESNKGTRKAYDRAVHLGQLEEAERLYGSLDSDGENYGNDTTRLRELRGKDAVRKAGESVEGLISTMGSNPDLNVHNVKDRETANKADPTLSNLSPDQRKAVTDARETAYQNHTTLNVDEKDIVSRQMTSYNNNAQALLTKAQAALGRIGTDAPLSPKDRLAAETTLMKDITSYSTDDEGDVKSEVSQWLATGIPFEGGQGQTEFRAVTADELQYAVAVAQVNDDNWLWGLGNPEVPMDSLRSAVLDVLNTQGTNSSEAERKFTNMSADMPEMLNQKKFELESKVLQEAGKSTIEHERRRTQGPDVSQDAATILAGGTTGGPVTPAPTPGAAPASDSNAIVSKFMDGLSLSNMRPSVFKGKTAQFGGLAHKLVNQLDPEGNFSGSERKLLLAKYGEELKAKHKALQNDEDAAKRKTRSDTSAVVRSLLGS